MAFNKSDYFGDIYRAPHGYFRAIARINDLNKTVYEIYNCQSGNKIRNTLTWAEAVDKAREMDAAKNADNAAKARGVGYFIPGEAVTPNCVKVFVADKLFAVVKNEQSARTLIEALKLLLGGNYTNQEYRYRVDFIEGIGW